MNLKLNKGQISIEMIIILAVLIIAAILVGVLVINSSNKSIDSADETNQQIDNTVEGYVETLKAYRGEETLPTPPLPDVFSATIISPLDSESFLNKAGVIITLDATFVNGTPPVTCKWYHGANLLSSDCTDSLLAINIGSGVDNLTLTATDSDGNVADDMSSLSIFDEFVNGNLILNPPNGDLICNTDQIFLHVQNSDFYMDGGFSCTWTIGGNTLNSTSCAFLTSEIASVYGNGNVDISVEVTNDLGQTGTDAITVNIDYVNCP